MSTDNQIDTDLAREYFGVDDEIQERRIALQMAYLRDSRELSEEQKTNFKAGVEAGLPKDGFRLELKLHRMKNKHARQLQNALDEEENDTRESAEAIRNALGDYGSLPLGAAAVEKAEGKSAKTPNADAPKRGRPKKTPANGDAPETTASSDPLSTLINDDVPGEKDLRPPFLRDKDQAAAEANAAALAGMKTLN